MRARTTEKPFNDPEWLFEVNWEGIRAIAYIGEEVSLKTDQNEELIQCFPELCELTELAPNTVLDGMIIIMKEGKSDLDAVHARSRATKDQEIKNQTLENPASYIVFDILEHDGMSLIDLPLMDRLETLGVVLKTGSYVVQSKVYAEGGEYYYDAVVKKEFNGVIAKRKDSRYLPGSRSSDWLVIK